MGIKDATFIRAEKLTFSPEARQQALDGARRPLEQSLVENQYLRTVLSAADGRKNASSIRLGGSNGL